MLTTIKVLHITRLVATKILTGKAIVAMSVVSVIVSLGYTIQNVAPQNILAA